MFVEESETSRESLRILHVLTLDGANGEYGGPNRVAHGLCTNLKARGHKVEIFTGVQNHSIPRIQNELKQTYEIVRPLSKKFPISSLWSSKLPMKLYKRIKQSDLVHIHFARDLIPLLAALLCLSTRTPYVTQTHGMVIPDTRRSTRVLDFFITRFLLNNSKINLVLTRQELLQMTPLSVKCQMGVLPNGIQVSLDHGVREKNKMSKIVFCSRLHPRKRPIAFLNLASEAFKNNFLGVFEIFGPDGGELRLIQKQISTDPNLLNTYYKGSLPPSQVLEVLRQSDLLVLPSENEPFPMVVLEALSVGTRVLIMPSCGIASLIKERYPMMVLDNEEGDLFRAFQRLLAQDYTLEDRMEVQKFCQDTFGIDSVVDSLEKQYLRVISKSRNLSKA